MILPLIGFVTTCLGQSPQGFFTVHKTGTSWSFTTPSGQPFWSFAPDCVDTGTSKKDYKATNKSYASFRLFTSDQEWVQDATQKLKQWGFNSTGGWSDDDLFRKYAGKDRMPYFVVLHLGAYDLAPWHDLFSPQMERLTDAAAKKQILPVANDPYLVGYFTDNELGWWDDTLFKSYLGMKPTAPGRRVLIETLKKFYSGDFQKFEKDWVTSTHSFESITTLHQRPGGTGRKAINAFVQALGERYYSLMKSTIRRYDKRHLILGDRYCQYYSMPIVRAASKYVDVISTNFGADWNDGSIAPFFLRTLNTITKKPVIVTEFYMSAKENRSGNKNSGSAFPLVKTQVERAAAFGKYVRSLASLPYVVGAHWFQFSDEPANGRGDGEDWNMGLVDTEGRPYEEMVATCRSLGISNLRSQAKDPLPLGRLYVPSLPVVPSSALKDWPREKGVIQCTTGQPFADMFVAQDNESLYLGLYAMDYMDESLYVGGHIPNVDRNHWQIRLSSLKIDVRYGGKNQRASVNVPGIEVKEVEGLKYTVILKIPNKKLSFFDGLPLSSSLDSHGRGEHMEWKTALIGVK